eukprot:COSAG01_NODE_864_length_13055_cov_18.442498_6_plen_96_part_00
MTLNGGVREPPRTHISIDIYGWGLRGLLRILLNLHRQEKLVSQLSNYSSGGGAGGGERRVGQLVPELAPCPDHYARRATAVQHHHHQVSVACGGS